jgi:hypothetical protein
VTPGPLSPEAVARIVAAVGRPLALAGAERARWEARLCQMAGFAALTARLRGQAPQSKRDRYHAALVRLLQAALDLAQHEDAPPDLPPEWLAAATAYCARPRATVRRPAVVPELLAGALASLYAEGWQRPATSREDGPLMRFSEAFHAAVAAATRRSAPSSESLRHRLRAAVRNRAQNRDGSAHGDATAAPAPSAA